MDKLLKARQDEDLTIPHDCHAAYMCPNMGADLNEIEPFTEEFTSIVDKMKEEMVNEKRLLEGTDVPVYTPLENELSGSETKEDQWKIDSQSGSWRTGPTLILADDSNISSCIAEPFNRYIPTPSLSERSTRLRTTSYAENSDVSGCATATMNESSECMVPTTSEPTPGTPSGQK